MMVKKSKSDFEFFMKKDFSKDAGNWVAICNRKVIASDVNATKVLKVAEKKCNSRKPIFAKIPRRNQIMIL